MDDVGAILAVIDVAMREIALFAAFGFLLLGLGDLAIDLIWLGRNLWRRATIYRRHPRADATTLPPPARPGGIAIFVPAWDEADVIGAMLRNALAAWDKGDHRIYVGCYPNDPATIDAVRTIADPRVRLVIGPVPGPTTKACCLNRLWEAMVADEVAEAFRFKAVALHDAEDVVHSAELHVFDSLIERFGLVQLPVLPMIDANSRWIAAHYADEFAESHGKELVVREALGASIPSAGVGCAFARDALAEIAGERGLPFDAESLTEDYELGLRLHALGHRSAFVRLPAAAGRRLVVTKEYFPSTIEAAVNQKCRWMIGIALSGWDRMGWRGGLAERWMRLRDRRSVLAAVLLVAGYAALLLWTGLWLAEMLIGYRPAPIEPPLKTLLMINAGLLTWRLAMRAGFVTQVYGWREGLRSVPRVVIGNAIAMLAARRAITGYARRRSGGASRWDKTAHAFPAIVPAE